ncbi:MAG TPA: ABC transporter ATP-binding protein [Blastocatellia bacterium]|nr:ABC transporter ATP-binding protein [Blastocatellia bacterium]
MKDSRLKLDAVIRNFGEVEVLKPLSLEIAGGEFVAIVGPSGCGKTTLLNLLSGYDQPSAGTITRHGRTRMVYQQDGLFPWLTVAENIELGLRHLKDPAERERQSRELISLIKLEGFEQHYPHMLSGGMKQRVEIARALAGETDVLLLDEPFSALDYLTRLRMRRELARLLHARPRTVVLVTHDIEEAAQLADRVIVLSDRPAVIRREWQLHEPRPRDLTHPEVVQAVHQILMEMGLERDFKSAAAPLF